MGFGMAQRLLRAGHELSVFNRTGAKATELERAGARVCLTPREAGTGAEAVIAMTADDASSRSVWLGPNGVLAAGPALASDADPDRPVQHHRPPHVMRGAHFAVCHRGPARAESGRVEVDKHPGGLRVDRAFQPLRGATQRLTGNRRLRDVQRDFSI